MEKEMEKQVNQALGNHETRLSKLEENLASLAEHSTESSTNNHETRLSKLEESQASLAEHSTESSTSEAQLKETQEKVADLEEKLSVAQGITMDDFTPDEKANFVISWAKDLPAEKVAVFAELAGIPLAVAEVKTETVAAEEKTEPVEAEVEETPKIIEGKTDLPGYRYLSYLDRSIKD